MWSALRGTMSSHEIEPSSAGILCALSCPECGGSLWEMRLEGLREFRCHVGHVYSSRSLDAAQHGALERALWEAVRIAKDNAALAEHLSDDAVTHKFASEALAYSRNASEKRSRARSLVEFLAKLDSSGQSHAATVIPATAEPANLPAPMPEPSRATSAPLHAVAGWFRRR